MSALQFKTFPAALTVRENQVGGQVLVTLMLDLEVLSCLTPQMVEKEAVGVSTRLQPDPSTDGAGGVPYGCASTGAELQTYDVTLDRVDVLGWAPAHHRTPTFCSGSSPS